MYRRHRGKGCELWGKQELGKVRGKAEGPTMRRAAVTLGQQSLEHFTHMLRTSDLLFKRWKVHVILR